MAHNFRWLTGSKAEMAIRIVMVDKACSYHGGRKKKKRRGVRSKEYHLLGHALGGLPVPTRPP